MSNAARPSSGGGAARPTAGSPAPSAGSSPDRGGNPDRGPLNLAPALRCDRGHLVAKHATRFLIEHACAVCHGSIERHETRWSCTQNCAYDVCQACVDVHWAETMREAETFASSALSSEDAAIVARSTQRLLREVPPHLRGMQGYARVASRFDLDVPRPLGLVLHQAWNVPGPHLHRGLLDTDGKSNAMVLVEVLDKAGACIANAKSQAMAKALDPVWDQILSLPSSEKFFEGSPRGEESYESFVPTILQAVLGGSQPAGYHMWPAKWDVRTTSVRFSLFDKNTIRAKQFLGQCVVPLTDLIRRPHAKWMLFDESGEAVLGSRLPHQPCELTASLVPETLPESWHQFLPDAAPCRGLPQEPNRTAPGPDAVAGEEQPSTPVQEAYPFHAFIMTRGTRGDVQPFVALARGLAERKGWLVTLCTELRWRDLVKANSDVSQGRVQFRPSGGDTEARIRGRMAQLLLRSRGEMLQMVALSKSQEQSFPSATVFAHHIERLENDGMIVDAVIFGFTAIEVAALVCDKFKKPMIGFILQPSIIPSKDPRWAAVSKTARQSAWTMMSWLDGFQEAAFTSHKSLKALKSIAERNPLTKWNLDAMRMLFGLETYSTWKALRARGVPMICPMQPGTFDTPSDWWEGIQLTSFIRLSSKPRPAPEGAAVREVAKDGGVQNFLEAARAAGARVGLMTFSSMPVPRQLVLRCATKMINECSFNLRLIYVGQKVEDGPGDLEERAAELAKEGRFLDLEQADFGRLFSQVDCFIVHGGLGTTFEALRTHKPCCVTGPLLLDQRFWGNVCFNKGVGPKPVHIDNFEAACVKFVDGALDPADPYEWQARAKSYNWGDDDGVQANVDCIAGIVERGLTPFSGIVRTQGKRFLTPICGSLASVTAPGDSGPYPQPLPPSSIHTAPGEIGFIASDDGSSGTPSPARAQRADSL